MLEEDNDSFRTVISEEVFIPEMLEVLDAKNIVHENGGYLLPVTLCSTDTENYEKLCDLAGVQPGANILVNYARIPGGEGEGKSIFDYSFKGRHVSPFFYKPLFIPISP